MPNDASEPSAELRAEVAALRAEVARLRGEPDTPAAEAHQASFKEKAEQRVSDLEHEVERLSARLRARGQAGFREVEAQVAARPLSALAVAFAVGVLSAQLLRR